MKWGLAALFLAGVALVAFGLPGSDPDLRRAARFGGEEPILPMRFAHNDHLKVSCTTCHHEFTDRRTGPPCMTCHVTDAKVAPLLEHQFHTLCRSCHMQENAAAKPSGPTRACVACHQPDDAF